MTQTRIALIAVAIVLTGLIISAMGQANLLESFAPIAADPWGLVSLIDLYAGFLAAAVLVWLLEPDKRLRWLVIVPLFVLGNPILLIWLALRLPTLVTRIGSR